MDSNAKKLEIMQCMDDVAVAVAYEAMKEVLKKQEEGGVTEFDLAPTSIRISNDEKGENGLTLYKQKKSPFFWVRVTIPQKGIKAIPKSTRKSTIVEATKQAYRIQSEVMAQWEAGTLDGVKTSKKWNVVCGETINELKKEVEEKKAKTGNNSKTMEAQYASQIANWFQCHPALARLRIDEVQYPELWDLAQEQKYREAGKSTATQLKTALKKVFEFALRKRYISQMPKLPTFGEDAVQGKETPVFETKDLDLLLTNFESFYEESRNFKTRLLRAQFPMYFNLLGSCGLRPGKEALGMKWSDIKRGSVNYGSDKISAYYVTVRRGKMSQKKKSKGGKIEYVSREIIMYPDTAIALEQLYYVRYGETKTIAEIVEESRDERLFVTHDNKEPNFADTFKQYVTGDLLKKHLTQYYTLYSVRHEFINGEIDRGVSKEDVAEQCGNSVQTIDKYYRKYKSMNRVTRILSKEQLAHFNPHLQE